MSRLDLVMIVRDEARCLERCLASARPWVDGIVVARHRLDRCHGRDRPPPRRARGALRLDRRLRGRAQCRARPRATPTGGWCSMPTNGSPKAASRSAALRDAGAGLRRPDPRRQPVRCGRRPRRTRRRAGCRGSCRAASLSGSHPRAAARARCRAGACRCVVGHDGYLDAQKAAKARPQRAPARPGARRPSREDAYLHYQLGKDLELRRAASPRPSRTIGARWRAATRAPAGATTWCCAPCSR